MASAGDMYFPTYLTSPALLALELNDNAFRRQACLHLT